MYKAILICYMVVISSKDKGNNTSVRCKKIRMIVKNDLDHDDVKCFLVMVEIKK